jgi:hypothetical protein
VDNKVTWIETSDSKCRDKGIFTIHTNIYSVCVDNKVTWIEASDSKCRDQGNFTIHTNIYSVWIIKLRGSRQVTVNVAIKVILLSTLISIQCG